jgi:hypothetical protein
MNQRSNKMDSAERAVYEIHIFGHLDDRRARAFAGMDITHLDGGVTSLVGPVPDQAALYGLLTRIRDLGVPLISVQRTISEDNIESIA